MVFRVSFSCLLLAVATSLPVDHLPAELKLYESISNKCNSTNEEISTICKHIHNCFNFLKAHKLDTFTKNFSVLPLNSSFCSYSFTFPPTSFDENVTQFIHMLVRNQTQCLTKWCHDESNYLCNVLYDAWMISNAVYHGSEPVSQSISSSSPLRKNESINKITSDKTDTAQNSASDSSHVVSNTQSNHNEDILTGVSKNNSDKTIVSTTSELPKNSNDLQSSAKVNENSSQISHNKTEIIDKTSDKKPEEIMESTSSKLINGVNVSDSQSNDGKEAKVDVKSSIDMSTTTADKSDEDLNKNAYEIAKSASSELHKDVDINDASTENHVKVHLNPSQEVLSNLTNKIADTSNKKLNIDLETASSEVNNSRNIDSKDSEMNSFDRDTNHKDDFIHDDHFFDEPSSAQNEKSGIETSVDSNAKITQENNKHSDLRNTSKTIKDYTPHSATNKSDGAVNLFDSTVKNDTKTENFINNKDDATSQTKVNKNTEISIGDSLNTKTAIESEPSHALPKNDKMNSPSEKDTTLGMSKETSIQNTVKSKFSSTFKEFITNDEYKEDDDDDEDNDDEEDEEANEKQVEVITHSKDAVDGVKQQSFDENQRQIAQRYYSNFEYPTSKPSSGNFLSYLIMATIIAFIFYVAYYKKQQILAIIVEGPNRHSRSRKYSYKPLPSDVSDVIPMLKSV